MIYRMTGVLLTLVGVTICAAALYYGLWWCLVLSICDLINQCKAPVTDAFHVGADLFCILFLWEIITTFGMMGGIMITICGAVLAGGSASEEKAVIR